MDYTKLIKSTAESTVYRILKNAVNPQNTVSGSYNRKPNINSNNSYGWAW